MHRKRKGGTSPLSEPGRELNLLSEPGRHERVDTAAMVQEFHVLQCYSCRTFQVHQVKKAKKWTCKMCGEKQSLLKEFGRGTGADCRCHVQKLNAKRGEMEQGTCLLSENDKEVGLCLGGGAQNVRSPDVKQRDAELAEKSRWDKYLMHTPQEGEVLGEEPDDTDYLSISNLRGNGNSRKRQRVVGRADDCSFNKEMRHHRTEGKPAAFPLSKSSTAQHTLLSIRPSSNQTRHGLPGGTINTDPNQASQGFTRGTINTDHNQASQGFTRGTINTDHNQASQGFTRGTINTDHNQASPGFTRGTINTDHNQASQGFTRGTINTDHNQASQGFTRGTINTDHNQASQGFTRGTINTDHNQASQGFTRGTINTDHNQASQGFTRGTINTDHNQASQGFTRGAINTDLNQASPGFTRGTINTDKITVAGLMPTTNTVELNRTKIASNRFRPFSVVSSAAAPISRWTQFLPAPHPQGEEEGEEEEEDVGEVVSHPVNNMENDTLGMLGSSATPISKLGRLSELPEPSSSHSLHPPPHQPGPSLPFHSLFNTSDDLDSFDLDDVF